MHCDPSGGSYSSIKRTRIASLMKTTTATADRPNRVLIALAAAWMILSLAIGGAMPAETSSGAAAPAPVTSTTEQ